MTTTTTYIAFLRAINVSGRTVKMERLRALFAELGLGNVRSYIQTGNVFFTTEEPADEPTAGAARAALTGRIEEHLERSLGYPVPVMLRTVDEVAGLLAAEPFRGVAVTPDVRLVLAFLSEPLPASLPLPFRSPKGNVEVLGADQGAAYVVVRQDGKWVTEGMFGKAYQGSVTSRFLHTTEKILAAARKA
ncbi:DUF1697 domain-containing protein [Streptomyces sp. 1331.2]|uniref:DUF1697 domain-containing protein n=1 Tax=Streptomyces sp. 1331.2 TaxID=1938835 RepID=UPI000BD482B7|nr:DUF1697 domain-containing protein [Streptomyces sp. 1331.2]SOB84474.1 Uncharacterized conserved protein, DUF1697 family [Streptomyces sp. 1331.2]